jgi:hypothetical protein
MMLDNNYLSQSIFNYKNAANSYLKMSDNAKKLGLKDEQTISKNESRYDLDGTLKEEHLPIGSPEREKKKEEAEEEKKVFGTDKTEKTDGNILSKDVRDKEKDDKKGLFGIKKDGFTKDPPDCECETCRKRRYQDDSDDSMVSFQSPTRMTPNAARSKVMSHELEHVRREGIKARQEGKQIVSQTVQIMTDTCEECGRIYVSGGLTRTVTRTDMRDFHQMFMLGFEGKDASGREIS